MSAAVNETAPLPKTVLDAQLEIAEVFGDIAEFWGFTRTQGRVYGLLFLSPYPLGHGEIRDRLDVSAGSISMTINSLLEWEVLQREGRAFRAETNFWKVITGVIDRREREHVDRSIERVAELIQRLRRSKSALKDARAGFVVARLEHLYDFFRLGRTFLNAFVAKHPVHNLLGSIVKRAARIPTLSQLRGHHDA